jgi:hypothetical protein
MRVECNQQPPMIDDAVEAFDVLLNADVHAIKDEGLLSYLDALSRASERPLLIPDDSKT